MKIKSIGLAAAASVLLGTAAFSIKAQTPAPVPAPTPSPAPGKHAKGERHPEIRKAMHALMNAQNALEHADHDFAGHREKALDYTQQALKECQAALAADRK
jgi:hypothetical protein